MPLSALTARYLRAGSTALCALPILQQRQAAVMALFLTGMINDGAHTANGPARLAFIRQGRRGERGAGRQTGVCGG